MDGRLTDRAEGLGIRWFLPKLELVKLPDLLDELYPS
jgi:hypothetical protein